MIPDNDPVRLLNACVEGMDLSELYKTYTRVPKNLATPKQLFKIVAYAAMNGTYSSRKIEAACRQNINYMYMLEGKLHWKIQSQKTGIRLYELIETA